MIRAADRLSSGITVFEYFPGGFRICLVFSRAASLRRGLAGIVIAKSLRSHPFPFDLFMHSTHGHVRSRAVDSVVECRSHFSASFEVISLTSHTWPWVVLSLNVPDGIS